MSPLVLRRRAPGDFAKDAMELWVAAKTSVKGGVEQCALAAGVALHLIAVKESLHALTVAELDEGEAGLLFEEAAEA